MNKLFKGAIAGAAGVALLLGGAGTFALWNDTATFGADGFIDAGHLQLIKPVSGTWTVNNGDPIGDISSVALVPGDVITYSADVGIVAHGDYLTAQFGITDPTADQTTTDGATLTDPGAGVALLDELQPMTWTITPPEGAAVEANTIEITGMKGMPSMGHPNDGPMHHMTYHIELSMTFNPDTEGTTAQGGRINLSNYQLTLEQITTPGAGQATPTA